MLEKIKLLLSNKAGDGILSSLLWLAVTAIVSGTIAYSIWAQLGSSATTVKSLITTTIH